MNIFLSYPSVLTFVLGAQKNHLIVTNLLSSHNILFGLEIKKKKYFLIMHFYLGGMPKYVFRLNENKKKIVYLYTVTKTYWSLNTAW